MTYKVRYIRKLDLPALEALLVQTLVHTTRPGNSFEMLFGCNFQFPVNCIETPRPLITRFRCPDTYFPSNRCSVGWVMRSFQWEI